MKFVPAVTNTDSVDKLWYTWHRGAEMSQGSALPFEQCMQAVSGAMHTLNTQSEDPTEAYKQCIGAAQVLRHVLVDVFPKWTHRQQSTQVLPDAREPYV